MNEALELAVVIPTFNELRNVPVLIAKLDAALAGRRWEAIFVDDDSPDGTAQAARDLALRDARVRVIQRIAACPRRASRGFARLRHRRSR
jgi:dolichol-phosphate mannosyltransferase